MSDLERKLEELFASDARARRVGRVVITPRSAFLAGPAFIGAVALAMIVALVVLTTFRPRENVAIAPSASASATTAPSATAPGAVTTPSATAQSSAYGYVDVTGGRLVVRRERDGSAAFELTGVSVNGSFGPTVAVSADGKRLAYWRATPNVGATQLRVVDVAAPSSDHAVYDVAADSLGGYIVWSNDGLGLLVSVYSRETVGQGCVECGAPARYDLLMIDLASSPAAVEKAAETMTGGGVYVPVGWDRPSRIAAGVTTGGGGFTGEYVTWNGSASPPFRRQPLRDLGAASLQVSPDGKLVAAAAVGSTGLRVWPLGDASKAQTIASDLRLGRPLWRSGTGGVYEFIETLEGGRVVLIRYPSGSSATIYDGNVQPSTGPYANYLYATAVRPDGSAVLVYQGSGDPDAPQRLFIVDIATGKTAEMMTRTGTPAFAARGVWLP